MRTFLGLSLPNEVRERIQGICYGLEEIRWVLPENFHTTLVFLGELDREQIETVSEISSQIGQSPFSIEVLGLGIFGHKSPEILYVSVSFSEALFRLQKSLDSSLRRVGFSLEKRDYKPHITIGRFKRDREKRLEMYLKEFDQFHIPNIEIREFHLFSSRSGSNGPIYSVEETYPLQLD
ncbi:RNA 2',3'-cyclic phosphodiesterase [Leptospira langatensis]|uniref:RNA 2',3'-cyclic phosphodiesterase n=1 Tax=Leptospira langatensis TaxID=2484983 RepID=A0A5F1ZV95_9LEPT|nr:RNA 2',3'-cyclic phosphodiesterase [Leptospira langatensis]TGK03012.1 RNA 2',3'-cyclic phosphodiesterase [Leptospira langatensis]TGL41768.1 RNA 2',3'-cyclic phosphodiesterase [Leptospira langatensis]